MSIIAENTRRIIQERGLKQCAVAQRAGYKVKTFNNLLTGRKIITDRDIEAIAKTLGVSPNVLTSVHLRRIKDGWELDAVGAALYLTDRGVELLWDYSKNGRFTPMDREGA